MSCGNLVNITAKSVSGEWEVMWTGEQDPVAQADG